MEIIEDTFIVFEDNLIVFVTVHRKTNFNTYLLNGWKAIAF